MARVIVVNPPHRKRRRVKRVRAVRHMRRRRFSAKARAAALRNLAKARRKISHRVRRKNPRRKRSRMKHKRRKFVNPFAGTLAIMGNPARKSRRKRKHTMAKRRRHKRSYGRALSNPFSVSSILAAPKEMVSSQFIMEAAGVAVGFVAPTMVMNYLPATWKSQTWSYYLSKVGVIAGLYTVGRMVSPRVARFVLVGGGVSLMLDLYTEVISGKSPAMVPAPAPTTGTQTYYGDLSTYYGSLNDWDIP